MDRKVRLDGADLSDTKLWEAQRGGWSIKNVICQVAFWNRERKEPTKYEEGEFERIFAEKPLIILPYEGVEGGPNPGHFDATGCWLQAPVVPRPKRC